MMDATLMLHILRNPHGWSVDQIREARLTAADEFDQLRTALAESQARARQLHVRLDAVLEFMDPRNHQTHCECDPSVGYQCAACSWPTLPEIAPAYALLAMRTNDEALREMIEAAKAEEREACAQIGENWDCNRMPIIEEYVDAIRARKP